MIDDIFEIDISMDGNFAVLENESELLNQNQTNDVFSDKWSTVDSDINKGKAFEFQYEWFLKLYGFEGEKDLQEYLQSKNYVFDAGCGLGYKTSWFAKLAPSTTVIGMDFSDAVHHAAKNYSDLENLYFVQGDIANTKIRKGLIDCVICDQVIMHTEDPKKTFQHLSSLVSAGGEFLCYVYAKKALPRELVDDFFRSSVHKYSKEEIWELSKQLTELGKVLSELDVKFESPDIPLLGIKGGEYDIQRFIYWNFLKCFWRDEWGRELSEATNFDWYSPSNAMRFSEDEFLDLVKDNNLSVEYFHKEEACYSGRFKGKK